MIDLDDLTYKMHPELKDYSGIPQLIEKNQDIPRNKLIYPRIMINWIVRYSPEARHSMVAKYETVPSEEEDFDDDIEYTYIANPTATLSLQAFGDDVDAYINNARQWFILPQHGRRFFNKHDVVIQNITETQDRKPFFETEYEERPGFDVVLSFNEEVKAREKTIEKVTLRDEKTGETRTLNL